MYRYKTILPITALFAFPTAAVADDTEGARTFAEQVDAVMAPYNRTDGPGCSVGVIEDGRFIHAKGYGMANLELGAAIAPHTVFRMGSVSKQFTATAVQLMAEDGLIDLDTDIHTYLPELPDYGHKVTIRAMLGHFSGMGDYDLIAGSYEGELVGGHIDLRSVAGGPFRLGNEDYLSIKEFYDVVKRVPLALEPETELRYSNLAYFLLSMLVEEVTGQTLREYADEHMFAPLEMNATHFADDGNEIIKDRADGYAANDKGGFKTDMTNAYWGGDGGLHTSILDMLRWDTNFYKPKIGNDPAEFIKTMNTPNSDFDDNGDLHANGQFIQEIAGHPSYAHSGGWLGTSTYYMRNEEKHFSIAILCNDVNAEAGEYAEEIAVIYYSD